MSGEAGASVLHVVVSTEMRGYLQNTAKHLSSKFSSIFNSPVVLFIGKYLDYCRFLVFNFHACMRANVRETSLCADYTAH